MKLFNKYFFIGVAVGVALSIATLVGFGMYVSHKMSAMMEESGGMSSFLQPPEIPPAGKFPVYGQADFDLRFRTLEGQEAQLEDYRGKVIFVNFWATWCGPCVAEMPAIQKLHDSFLQDEDVVFLLLSDEDEETINDFMDSHQFDMPVYQGDNSQSEMFSTPGIPATFVVNRDGNVVLRHIGGSRWDDEGFQEFLRGLL